MIAAESLCIMVGALVLMAFGKRLSRCCCGGCDCEICDGGSGPDQVSVAIVAPTSQFGLCTGCNTVDGTYILDCDDSEGCLWANRGNSRTFTGFGCPGTIDLDVTLTLFTFGGDVRATVAITSDPAGNYSNSWQETLASGSTTTDCSAWSSAAINDTTIHGFPCSQGAGSAQITSL